MDSPQNQKSLSDDELQKQLESVLFAAGKRLSVEDIAKLCNLGSELARVEAGLQKLKEQYDASNSSLMIVQDGPAWKLTVREKYLSIVRKIVTQTELKKSVMETLAVLAYKAPMMQADLIKIRTNKAYDHLQLLEEEGYIIRKKKGRSKEIALAPKFFEYFDLPPDAFRDRFASVKELEKAVDLAEERLKGRKQDIALRKEEAKKKEAAVKKSEEEKIKALDKSIAEHPVIELMDAKGKPHRLETYDPVVEKVQEQLPSPVEIIENKLGPLEVVKSEPRVEVIEGEITALGEMEVVKETEEKEAQEIIGEGSPEAKDVDRRVAEILGGLSKETPPEKESLQEGREKSSDESSDDAHPSGS